MATNWDAVKDLGAADEFLIVDVPQDTTYQAVLRLSGTFTATIKIQKSTDNGGSYSDCTVYDSTGNSANPADADVFIANLGSGCDFCKVVVSAYTSGTARAQLVLVPDA